MAIDVPLATVSAAAPKDPPPGKNYQILGSEVLSYDSNPLMTVHPGQSLLGSTTAPELIFQDNTPLTHFSSDTVIDENVFNQSGYNSTDFHEKLDLNRQIEHWAAGIDAKADYDTTRTSELTNFGINLPKVQHLGLSAAPSLSYNATPLDKLSLEGSVSASRYDNNAFVDYNIYALNPSYDHRFDPMNTGTITLHAERYEATTSTKETTDNIGPSLGWTTILTPELTAKFSGGFERSIQNTSGAAQDSTWNYVFGADMIYKGQQDTIDLNTSRAQYPFGNGTETLLTSFSATETHAVNTELSFNVGGLYTFAQSAPGIGINLDNEYNVNAGLSYHITEHLDATANYQYKNETLTQVNGTIQEHLVLLGLTYHPFAGAI